MGDIIGYLFQFRKKGFNTCKHCVKGHGQPVYLLSFIGKGHPAAKIMSSYLSRTIGNTLNPSHCLDCKQTADQTAAHQHHSQGNAEDLPITFQDDLIALKSAADCQNQPLVNQERD